MNVYVKCFKCGRKGHTSYNCRCINVNYEKQLKFKDINLNNKTINDEINEINENYKRKFGS
jgi:hypothetical protein